MKEANANEVRDRKEHKELEKEIVFFNRFAWGLVIVGAVFMALIAGKLINGNPPWAQTLGDFTGGVVASFWSLAGIMFVYIAFLGQKQQLMLQEEELRLNRDELRLNRDEMIATRIEIEGQKREMEEQNKTATLQRFEGTVFNLFKDIDECVGSLSWKTTENSIYAHDVVSFLFEKFKELLNIERRENPEVSEDILIRGSFEKLNDLIKEHTQDFGPMTLLMQVMLVVEFIRYAEVSQETKDFYSKMFIVKMRGPGVQLAIYRSIAKDDDYTKQLMAEWAEETVIGGLSNFLLDVDMHKELLLGDA